jgi:HD-GYP domain-containing protein (c-di-GMP phosphodiesterase class II)
MALAVATKSVDADYLPIPVDLIFLSRFNGVAFYVKEGNDKDAGLRLYRGADYPFEEADLVKLRNSNRSKLYISIDDHHRFQGDLRDNLSDILDYESVDVKSRFSSLNEVMRSVLGDTFSRNDDDETVRITNEFARDTVNLVCRDDATPRDLCKVLYHDYYTFTHSTNVSVYCVMLAKQLGANEQELQAVAAGGLLHDLGKLGIAEKILLKPGRLTDEEFGVIKRHPTIGFANLCKREDLSFGQLMMVYQHHECPDGSGYPVGCVDREIHDWARICAVADVFEALTSNRPYRSRLPISEALSIMDRYSGGGLDAEVLQCWKTIICEE